MRIRKDEWIITIAFCAFLGIMSVLFFLLPKSDFSEVEKRYLAKTPVLTEKTVTSGKFGTEVETYMADHIPGRDFFVGMNAYVDFLTGRQVIKDVYVAKGDRLVETPVQWNENQAKINVEAIGVLSQKLGRQIDLMIVPSAGWALEDTIIGLSDHYYDEDIISNIYTMAQLQTDSQINCMNVSSVLGSRDDIASLYYKTDHHWTSKGAYLTYAAYMDYKEKEYPKAEDFSVETANGFRGSTYSRSALWMTPGEPLEMWTYSKNLQVTNDDNDQVHAGAFYKERLKEADMYTTFLDGNHGVVRIENPDNVGKGSILVVRDSYSNCLGPFLAESYETVVLVDLRWIKPNVSVLDMCGEESFDDILVCYSIGNFMTDNNLYKLKY